MRSPINTDFIQQSLAKNLKGLPALPTVVAKVIQETEKPDASAAGIERLISTDQALASRVLRVVNSAYYGLSGQVSNLGQAIMILGTQQVRNLVLSVAAVSTMQPRTVRQHEVLNHFWLHAFSAASCVQLVGRRKGVSAKEVELAFVGGLLHDIGRLFLFSCFTQTYDQVLLYAAEQEQTLEEAEVKLLGMTHAKVGHEMCTRWNLPAPIVAMVASHEGPLEPDADNVLKLVHLADAFCKPIYYSGSSPKISFDPVAWEWLAFSESEVAELELELDEKKEAASQLYGVLNAA